jgi:hypothetical protein
VDLLAHTTGLVEVDLSANGLTALPPGLFDALPLLEEVDLSGNALQELPEGLFAHNPLLRRLDLSRNALARLPAHLFGAGGGGGGRGAPGRDRAMEPSHSLTRLSLHHNRLVALPQTLLPPLRLLAHLDASHNQLSGPGRGPGWPALPSLTHLDLSFNALTHLPSGWLTGAYTPALVFLSLAHNRLGALGEGALAHLPALHTLHLHGNPLGEGQGVLGRAGAVVVDAPALAVLSAPTGSPPQGPARPGPRPPTRPSFAARNDTTALGPVQLLAGDLPGLRVLAACDVVSGGPPASGAPQGPARPRGDGHGVPGRGARGPGGGLHATAGAVAVFVLSMVALLALGLRRRRPQALAKAGFAL